MRKIKYDLIFFVLKYLLTVVFLIVIVWQLKQLFPEKKVKTRNISDIFNNIDTKQIDSILLTLSLEEKVHQLIIYKADTVNSKNINLIQSDIEKYKPGGIILNADSLKNYYNLKDSIDNNFGINCLTFINSETVFPNFAELPPSLYNISEFSVVFDDTLKCRIYNEAALFSKNINAGADILSDNSVKSFYSIKFSDISGYFYDNNRLLCVDEKSINGNYFSESIEEIIKTGLTCLIINDSSNYEFRKKLKDKLSFSGIRIFDLTKIDTKILRDSIVKSFKYGADFFITQNPALVTESILSAVENKQIKEAEIDFSVKRILAAKIWTKTIDRQPKKRFEISKKYYKKILVLYNTVVKKSISIIKNSEKFLPLSKIYLKRIFVVTVGKENMPEFLRTVKSYQNIYSSHIDIEKTDLKKEFKKYGRPDVIIFNFNNIKVDEKILNEIDSSFKLSKKIMVNYVDTSNLSKLKKYSNLMFSYGNDKLEQKYAAELILGGFAAEENNLKDFNIRSIKTTKTRIAYAQPEEVGMNSESLMKIDSIANFAIYKGVFPGCQLTVIKDGVIVYEKSFGNLTYSKRKRVSNSDLYDLASITKIAATTLAAMKMYETGRLGLDKELGAYFKNKKINYLKIKNDTIIQIDTLLLADIKNMKKLLQKQDTIMLNDTMVIAYDTLIVSLSPKNNIFKVTPRDLLTHKSGVTPVLPILPYLFYKKEIYDLVDSLKHKKQDSVLIIEDSLLLNRADIKQMITSNFNKYYSIKYIADSAKYKIADNFYFRNNYLDTLWENTKALRVYSRKIYQYSDVNMILLQQAIDSINRQSLDKYLNKTFYKPLSLKTTCYKPLKHHSKFRIAPTENDKYWRSQTLQGNVHDPSAAMLGGISGNAGLFSNSHDLGIIGQMLLNGGSYGGQRFLKKSTIDLFTSFQEGTHRGLGFDKANKKSITGDGVPIETYGHTGFTGTCIWIDPINNIVFVFLSNRVYPNQKNWRINTYKIREKMQTAVYESLK